MTHCDSCILAVDAGGTSLKAALVPTADGIAAVHASSEISPDTVSALMSRTFLSVKVSSDGSRAEILGAYEEAGRKGAEAAAREGLSVARAAVCIPGPFDYADGRSLMKHKYKEIFGISLTDTLLKGIGTNCPCTFLHDSTAFLLGAVSMLPASPASGTGPTSAGERDICGVTIGTGLGFACMKEGKIRQTPSGGPAVSIYARPYLDGTAEDYVSKRGILRRFRKETELPENPALTVADIAHMAREGNAAAAKVFADTGTHLGNILLPILREHRFGTVLLGGAISKSADLFLTHLSEVLAQMSVSTCMAPDIDFAPLLGAARYREDATANQGL